MLRLEGEGRKEKKGQEEEHRHRQQPRGPVQSRALPQGARQPHAGPGARVPTPSASRLPPRSPLRRARSFPRRRLPGLPSSSRRGPGGPSAAEPPGEGSGRCGAAPASHVEAKRRSPCPPRSPPGRGQSREQGTALSAPVSPPLPEASLGSSRGAGAAKPPRGVPQPGRGAAPEPRRAPSLHAKV